MTAREAYHEAKRRLIGAGVEDAAFDAACLFEKDTGLRRSELALRPAESCPGLETLWRDIDRRAAGEPLQYILGEWEFMGLRFFVGPGVLIPRPETELLAQEAADFLKGREHPRLLELCAGSGCVCIFVAAAVPGCTAAALELSAEAMDYLQRNIRLHSLENRVRAVRGDMLDPAAPARLGGRYDAIVCNPPYIPGGDIAALQQEVRREPRMALDGGEDGLRFYRALAPWASLLAPGGLAAFEVGAGEAPAVAELLTGFGLRDVTVKNDYSGIGRIVAGRRL